jgi:hypothetical protein
MNYAIKWTLSAWASRLKPVQMIAKTIELRHF